MLSHSRISRFHGSRVAGLVGKGVILKAGRTAGNFGICWFPWVGAETGEHVMPFSIPLALLGSQLVLVASVDRIPHLNYAPTCRNQTDPSAENIKQCMVNETVARDMMTQDWSQFTHRDKANCAWETSLDKSPSYINLYTCLEMEARNRKAPRSKIKDDF